MNPLRRQLNLTIVSARQYHGQNKKYEIIYVTDDWKEKSDLVWWDDVSKLGNLGNGYFSNLFFFTNSKIDVLVCALIEKVGIVGR